MSSASRTHLCGRFATYMKEGLSSRRRRTSACRCGGRDCRSDNSGLAEIAKRRRLWRRQRHRDRRRLRTAEPADLLSRHVLFGGFEEPGSSTPSSFLSRDTASIGRAALRREAVIEGVEPSRYARRWRGQKRIKDAEARHDDPLDIIRVIL